MKDTTLSLYIVSTYPADPLLCADFQRAVWPKNRGREAGTDNFNSHAISDIHLLNM